jgi:DsbC/DsbD-like thiol-disulfide interchange protein
MIVRPVRGDASGRCIMKNRILLFIIVVAIHFVCPSPSGASAIQVELIHSQDQYQIAGTYPILLRLKISEPWYIHGTTGQGSGLLPTVLSFHKSQGLKVERISFPVPERKKFDYTPDPIEVFSGDILVRATLVISENAPTGKQVLKGTLSYQACSSNVCSLPDSLPVTISVLVVPQGTATTTLNRDIFLSLTEESDVE